MSRRLRPLAALAIVALIGAGCSSERAEDDNAGNTNAANQEQAVKFAECMRDNGVKDFPDPANGEPLVDTRRIPSAAVEGGMTIINAAMQKCRDLAAEAAGQ
jgi:hypothetical protein